MLIYNSIDRYYVIQKTFNKLFNHEIKVIYLLYKVYIIHILYIKLPATNNTKIQKNFIATFYN